MLSSPIRLTASRHELDCAPEKFGWLQESNDLADDFPALRARFAEEGYLFLRGFFDRERVRSVRRSILAALAEEGVLDPAFPLEEGIAKEGVQMAFRPDLSNASRELQTLIYDDPVMAFYSGMFGEPARHYDFTWMRVVAPGFGTQPHMDVVYMGRGTRRLMTAWVPFGDVPLQVGGLIVLEKSHCHAELNATYGRMDVDTACENKDQVSELNAAGYAGFGALSDHPAELRDQLGGRWLTAEEFRMGDLLTFDCQLVHGSLDNQSRVMRLSSDSRYQPASEPADPRWVGENPPGHGGEMVRPLIC